MLWCILLCFDYFSFKMMSTLTFVFILLFTYICVANGAEPECSLPDNQRGICITLADCPEAANLYNKENKTRTDFLQMFKHHCGFQDEIPLVCCPIACYTPDGVPGECVGISSCPHLANLLKPPISKENKLYVQSSICHGQGQYTVCCGRPVAEQDVTVSTNCSATVTHQPPHLNTGCCGVESTNRDRILGGQEADVDQYPWLAVIEYLIYSTREISLACGGSLISSRYVLTAAHCAAGVIIEQAKPIKVRLGEYDTQNDGKDCKEVDGGGLDCTDGAVIIPIESYIVHPDYNTARKHSAHDIALIRMTRAAPFTDFIRPVCLPTIDLTLSPPANFITYAAGWGAVSNDLVLSNIKLYVDLPYVPKSECQKAYAKLSYGLQRGQICAGGISGKDSCRGDSGGPLVYYHEERNYYEVVGVVSFGPTCGTAGVPGVYTKVFDYIAWIRNNMKP